MIQLVDMGFNNGSVEKNILKEYFISRLGETNLMITSDYCWGKGSCDVAGI